MTQPTVSVLVPVFNGERFLETALSTIAAQTFTDIEVIVADDCSQDKSVAIAGKWQAMDTRFRVSTSANNLGMTANWNRALTESRGKYIVKLDCDDAMRPRCLEELVNEMERWPNVCVAYCRTLSCAQDLEPYASYLGDTALIVNRTNPLHHHILPGHIWYEMCFSDIQLWHSNAQMHRRDNLVQLGGWDSTWGCGSDTDLILRVLEQDKAVSHLPYAGILYRHHDDSISSNFRSNGWLSWEGTLIPLLSLARFRRAGNKPSSKLKKAWWRYWTNLQHLKMKSDLNEFPEPIRTNIKAAVAQVSRPSNDILLRGQVRHTLWQVRDLVRGRLHSIQGRTELTQNRIQIASAKRACPPEEGIHVRD